MVALRTLARRAHAMLKEARELQKAILAIIRSWRPGLLVEFGVGPIVAATVLCAWSHPGRIHSEAAFAMLAGTAPIPANSGQVTTRYRLNRYGDRHLNNALHTVVQVRIQYQPATRDYVARALDVAIVAPFRPLRIGARSASGPPGGRSRRDTG